MVLDDAKPQMRQHWKHRLPRCEVDLQANAIRFFALRRKDPGSQPLARHYRLPPQAPTLYSKGEL